MFFLCTSAFNGKYGDLENRLVGKWTEYLFYSRYLRKAREKEKNTAYLTNQIFVFCIIKGNSNKAFSLWSWLISQLVSLFNPKTSIRVICHNPDGRTMVLWKPEWWSIYEINCYRGLLKDTPCQEAFVSCYNRHFVKKIFVILTSCELPIYGHPPRMWCWYWWDTNKKYQKF